MKKIGIIGGAGPLASSLLYESIVHECYGVKSAIPEMFILNYPFTRCLTQDEKKSNADTVLDELALCIRQLEKQEVEIALLACNTLHLLLKRLPRPALTFYSLPESVLEAAKKDRARRLMVLGTQNSCRLGLYQDPLIDMVYPPTEEQHMVDRIIDRILEGDICAEDAASIGRMIESLSRHTDFDGVVLGCTDLPVLHHHHPIRSVKRIYDSIKIPAKKVRGLL